MDLLRLRIAFDTKWALKEETGCWIWLASSAGQRGYGQLKIPGARKQIYAHRASYLLHKGEIPRGKRVCHTCDVPQCVNPEHLFLGTAKENQQDMKRKGRSLFGSRNHQARLTDKDVLEIHALLQLGMSQRKIASLFDIHQMSVSKIKRGERWSHLKPK